MGDLHPLAVRGESHGVVAHDVAGAHGGKADGVARARTGLALARRRPRPYSDRDPARRRPPCPILRAVPEGASILWR